MPLGGLIVLVWGVGWGGLVVPFPLTAGLPLVGSPPVVPAPLGCGTPPHLMPVEQGLPWHPVATGLPGQAIPCVVAAPHVHALPSSTFWFLVPAVLAAFPACCPPSSLSAPPPPPSSLPGKSVGLA